VREQGLGGRDSNRLRATAFVTIFDRFAMPPLLVTMSRDLGVPLAPVAAAAGAYFLVYGLMQPVWGLVTDRLGLARTIRWAVLGGSAATVASALVTDVATLTVARVLAGLCFSAAFPSTLVYIGETVPGATRQREVSRLMAGVALGTASSTVVAGLLAGTVGWRWVFVLSGVVGALTAWFVWPLAEVDRPRELRAPWVPVLRVLHNPTAVVLLVLVAAEGAAVLGTFTFVPTAVETSGAGPAAAAAPAALYGAAVLVASSAVGRLAGRVPATWFMGAGACSAAGGSALVAWSQSPVTAAVTCLLLGICWASLHASMQTWATEVAPGERAAAVGLFAGSLFAGTAAAAAVGGRLADAGRFGVLFAGCAVLVALVGAFGSLARRHWESSS
jgi:predicted MFS family arabinose efflux permease